MRQLQEAIGVRCGAIALKQSINRMMIGAQGAKNPAMSFPYSNLIYGEEQGQSK
jgi:hypothetical protein